MKATKGVWAKDTDDMNLYSTVVAVEKLLAFVLPTSECVELLCLEFFGGDDYKSGGCGGTLKVKETRKEHDNGLRIVSVLELLQLGLDVGRRVLTRFENHALRLHAAVEPARRLQLRFLHN